MSLNSSHFQSFSSILNILFDDPTQNPNGPISITLGFTIGFIASITQSLGLTMQRKSNVLDQMKSKEQRTAGYRRPLWMFGFLLFLSSNILGSVAQLGSLPVIVLAPLGAVPLVWNAVFAHFLLGDKFSPYMVVGTLAIASGAMLIAIFGVVPIPAQSIEDLIRLLKRQAFVVYFSLSCVGLVVLLLVAHVTEFTLKVQLIRSTETLCPSIPSSSASATLPEESSDGTPTGGLTERTRLLPQGLRQKRKAYSSIPVAQHQSAAVIKNTKHFLAASYASASGYLSGMTLVISKAGVELLILTAQGNNQFRRWETCALIIGLFASFITQLWYQNKSLVFGDPIFISPREFSMTSRVYLERFINMYYDQFSTLSAVQLLLVFLGLCILLAGVWAVGIPSGNVEVKLVHQREAVVEESPSTSL